MAMQMENCETHQRPLILRLFFAAACLFFIILLPGLAAQVNAQPATSETAPVAEAVLLQLKPSRCVALHQGQVCYQNIQLLWSTPQVGHYCLYQQNAGEPLHCWENVNAGEYLYEFSSDESVQLQLVDAQTKAVVAQAGLEVAWVYKANTRRQTHWRLF